MYHTKSGYSILYPGFLDGLELEVKGLGNPDVWTGDEMYIILKQLNTRFNVANLHFLRKID